MRIPERNSSRSWRSSRAAVELMVGATRRRSWRRCSQVMSTSGARGRRAGADASHREHLSMRRVALPRSAAPTPPAGRACAPPRSESHRTPSRANTAACPRAASKRLEHQVGRHAATYLHRVARVLGREARPERAHVAVACRRSRRRNPSARSRGSRPRDSRRGTAACATAGTRRRSRTRSSSRDEQRESPRRPTTVTASPGCKLAPIEAHGADRRAVEQLRVERDDREVVQRMHVFDLARHLDRAART